mgnify:FL=1
MRVAFVADHTVHHETVPESAERLDRLAGLLTARGHDVSVLCSQWWEGDVDEFEHDGIEYVAVTDDPDDWKFPVRVPGALHEVDPEVVHAFGAPSHLAAARVGALGDTAFVSDVFDAPARGVLADRCVRFAAGGGPVVVPARTVATALREAGVPADALTTLGNPIEMERIRNTSPGDCGDIVYSRRLDEDANLESLLLALAEFREYDWGATVIGDGPERENYERQVRDLRIDDRVEFVGEKSVTERIALFKDAHVYVHTARRTTFATDLLRALACGCVGIVEYHAQSSAHELVEQEPRGFLATNDEEITERLVEAADIPREDVSERFADHDESAFAETYLDFYRAGGAGYD